jgi:carbamate kinase
MRGCILVRGTTVVALGGNALTPVGETGTAAQIEANAAEMARRLAELVRSGRRVAVVHGNGPQVGNLAIQQEGADELVPAQPLHQLCAMTQGQLGSVLVRELDRVHGAGSAVAVVCHVVVDPDDPAFAAPSKPIGPFFGEDRARRLAAARGWQVADDSGRGYRRVVPSPLPAAITEVRAVRTLLDAGFVVVAAGGGGVAVRMDADGATTGVDAVIDKDHAAALLATELGAQELLLVTAVDSVRLDYGTPDERPANELTTAEVERYLADGQFPAGSMGPKLEAALRFLAGGGSRVVVTSPAMLTRVAAGEPGVGTTILAAPVGAAGHPS